MDGYIPWEKRTAGHHEESVYQTVKRLSDKSQKISRGRDPVSQTADGNTAAFYLLPVTDYSDPPRTSESSEQNLRQVV